MNNSILSSVPRQLLIAPQNRLRIVQIGAGGTGGFLAANILKIIGGLSEAHKNYIGYKLIDGDTFEAKNLGRQLCLPKDIGYNKATVLVTRYANAYGVCNASAEDSYYTHNTRAAVDYLGTDGLVLGNNYHSPATTIVIDCVDRASPRAILHEYITERAAACLRTTSSELDTHIIACGNGEHIGQVWHGYYSCLYTETLSTYVPGGVHIPDEAYLSKPAIFSTPSPYIVMPSLIDISADVREDNLSCADRAAENVQTIVANNTAAMLALNYVNYIIGVYCSMYSHGEESHGVISPRSGSCDEYAEYYLSKFRPLTVAGVDFNSQTNSFTSHLLTNAYLKKHLKENGDRRIRNFKGRVQDAYSIM